MAYRFGSALDDGGLSTRSAPRRTVRALFARESSGVPGGWRDHDYQASGSIGENVIDGKRILRQTAFVVSVSFSSISSLTNRVAQTTKASYRRGLSRETPYRSALNYYPVALGRVIFVDSVAGPQLIASLWGADTVLVNLGGLA